ncbi:MAG: hypothetical protein IKR34_02940 [Candidatus Gastranaerophilales bacterium]|nr:hypothetical protein [Candidatus Gastranaerophilales bacterium]
MQTANALNNIIRILFNPKIEAFKLFDFLIVKSNETRYLAQITEIYDDKFDSSQNVAKLKIFYKISENDEVMPYDNFTPNKECEIVRIKQEEIENFINMDKETFAFATNVKNQMSLNIQYDFFNNNPVVLADKIECANTISLNIAKKLSEKKHVILIDSTGVIEHDCAKKITANKEIKIPLNFSTIDYVFDRCLNNASLEFQATVGPILNEIKNFARKQTSGFIPFNAFLRVILEQYKATPYPELKILITRMKKYQMSDIFARYKKDVENLHKAIEKNSVTILDISTVDTIWQKTYLEYLTDSIKEEIYLITRINDENCDTDLINKIYNKKKNINFIPTVSYNYKKLPSLIQYCKNYILMPSLYQRNDFLDANFALSNLITDECILFGENTDNFLYLAKDYELAVQEKRKNYKKIALSLLDREEQEELLNENLGNKGDYFENQQKNDSQKLIDELSALEKKNSEEDQQITSQEEFVEIQNPTPKDKIDEFEELTSEEEIKPKGVEDLAEEIVPSAENKQNQEENIEVNNIVFDSVSSDDSKENNETIAFEDILEKENNKDTDEIKIKDDEPVIEEKGNSEPEESDKEPKFSSDELIIENNSSENGTQEDKSESNSTVDLKDSDLLIQSNGETAIEEEAKETTKKQDSNEEISFSDEELDFFQIAQESEIDNTQGESDELDLLQIADDSVDTSFEDIINNKTETEKQTIEIDKDTKIDEEILENNSKEENLPIFKEEIKEDSTDEHIYNTGDKVSHKNYGIGTVIKIIKYEGRQLLQIEFEEAGKKTLEPRIANVQPVE